jgi:hypothetical protein
MALYQTALARILPPLGEVYLALLTSGPDVEGTHETEASYTGYARIMHKDWATHSDMDGWYVSNTDTIVFPAVTGSSIRVQWWGVYLTSVGGALFAAGPMLNAGGVAYPAILAVGDQARFLDDSLRIRSGT